MLRLVVWPQGQGWVAYAGQRFPLPLPPRSASLTRREGRAAYLVWGRPDLERFFATRAQRHGWTYVERFGPAYILTSEHMRLMAMTGQCGPFLTTIMYSLFER